MVKVSPALKKEMRRIFIGTAAGTALMFAVFGILHAVFPDTVPFDYTVILGGLIGGLIAAGNFFLMGLTVQKVSAVEDEAAARKLMQFSLSRRYLLIFLWGILAILLPAFNPVAGIVPLVFPSLIIKFIYPFLLKKENGGEAGEQTVQQEEKG